MAYVYRMNQQDIHKIRAFNRFYTRVIGLLEQHLLNSQYVLPQVRVMYEIYQHKTITAKQITELLSIDKGYLSRILMGFDKEGLIERKPGQTDGRVQEVVLSLKGEQEFLALNQASQNQIIRLFAELPQQDVQALIGHMDEIQRILSKISH